MRFCHLWIALCFGPHLLAFANTARRHASHSLGPQGPRSLNTRADHRYPILPPSDFTVYAKSHCGINHCLVKNVSTNFDIFISDEFSNTKKRYNLIISTCKVSKKTPWARQLTLAETEFSNVAHESRKALIIDSRPQIGRKRTRGSLFRA